MVKPRIWQRIAAGIVLLWIVQPVLPSAAELRLAVELNGSLEPSGQPGRHDEVVVAIDSAGHRWVARSGTDGLWAIHGWHPTLPIRLFACELAARPAQRIDGPQVVQVSTWAHGRIVFGADSADRICRDLAT